MSFTPDLLASLVLQEFGKLPAKRKPVVRDNGLREWVPLSGIVAEGKDGKLTCVALATGMKCLPSSKLSQARGNVLHDWHAETLAIRAFNRFVLDECHALTSGTKDTSDFIRRRSSSVQRSEDGGVSWHEQPFTWREDVFLHMYCSEAPCGDASMELTMASQEDATPWAIPDKDKDTTATPPFSGNPHSLQSPDLPDTLLPGRAYFSQLGIVRRKPSRGDAPPTLSKSCSDKLSLHQCTSLLSSLTSLLVAPDHAYISSLILPRSQYSASGCRRAFSDGSQETNPESPREEQQQPRMALLRRNQIDSSWGGGYKFKAFTVKTTDLEFPFSRRFSAAQDGTSSSDAPDKITPSPLSAARTSSGLEETTLNGVLQGRKLSGADIRAASFASRRRTWMLALEIAELLSKSNEYMSDRMTEILHTLCSPTSSKELPEDTGTGPSLPPSSPQGQAMTYGAVKESAILEPRRRVKEDVRTLVLKGWVRNQGDEGFVL